MIVTLNEDYTAINITSNLIEAWIDDNTIDLVLNIYESCITTPIEITVNNDVIEDDVLVISTSLLQQSGVTVSDGIYRLELVSNDEDDIVTEKYCLFVDVELKCKLITYISNNLTSNIYHLYLVLSNGETCVECNCNSLCTIYDEIITILDSDKDGCTTCS